MYSSSQPTAAEQIIGLCSIASLFFQCAFLMKDPAQKKEFQRHGEACHRDLERAIFRLPFHLPTSFDYILALSMAVSRRSTPESLTVSADENRSTFVSRSADPCWHGI